MTVAGQTAPGDGILVKGALIDVRTHDVIFRHYRHRVGIDHKEAIGSGVGILLFEANNVIVDHCSVSWGTDDLIAVYNGNRDVTIQHCIIAEGLNGTFRGVKVGGKGLQISGKILTQRVSALHNLLAHTANRVPLVNARDVQVVNNVIYNSVIGSVVAAAHFPSESVEFVNNFYVPGPKSGAYPPIRLIGAENPATTPAEAAATRVYLSGNIHPKYRPVDSWPQDDIVDQTDGGLPVVTTQFGLPLIPTQTDAVEAKTNVLNNAGMTVPVRGPVDARIIRDVHAGTGNGVPTGTSYPIIAVVTRPPGFDTDGDGMPNRWEIAHGLNPDDETDGSRVADNGYTLLENYLNELAGDRVPGLGASQPVPPRNLRVDESS
ncbi:MAG: hypothetical protein ACR2RB_05145 [Gammaproteobacteria bacterium]